MTSTHSIILIGGGGHAKVVMDVLRMQGVDVAAYVDPTAAEWLDRAAIPRLSEEQLTARLSSGPALTMSLLGVTIERLERRYQMMKDYERKGAAFPPIVHPSAIVSSAAHLSQGVQIMAGAIVNHGARIGEGAVINTGAVVEHDVDIGAGTHVAPRAVLLGSAKVGVLSFIGSNSVIVQNASVLPHTFVKALRVHGLP